MCIRTAMGHIASTEPCRMQTCFYLVHRMNNRGIRRESYESDKEEMAR